MKAGGASSNHRVGVVSAFNTWAALWKGLLKKGAKEFLSWSHIATLPVLSKRISSSN
jgi:hypothetical protein